MDAERFDRIVRSVPSVSRRGMIRVLTALVAGGSVLPAFLPDEAAAKCVKPGKICKKQGQKKKKCCGGAKCQGKKCVCPANRVTCGGVCCPIGRICANNLCKLAVGAACDKTQPGQCVSGICGCNGNLCACRAADCKAPAAACVASLECCQGVCVGGACAGG